MSEDHLSDSPIVRPLEFPVLRFARGMVFPARHVTELSECTKAALKNGFFSGLVLVDSAGTACKIKAARKLHGTGPFFGFNVFLNQRLRVELVAEGEPFEMKTEEIKTRVLRCFHGAQEWPARSDLGQLIVAVEQAKSRAEIAEIVARAYFATAARPPSQ